MIDTYTCLSFISFYCFAFLFIHDIYLFYQRVECVNFPTVVSIDGTKDGRESNGIAIPSTRPLRNYAAVVAGTQDNEASQATVDVKIYQGRVHCSQSRKWTF